MASLEPKEPTCKILFDLFTLAWEISTSKVGMKLDDRYVQRVKGVVVIFWMLVGLFKGCIRTQEGQLPI